MSRRQLARVAAPAAFLLAATVAVLLVRSALDERETSMPQTTVATAPAATQAQAARTTTAARTTAPAPTATQSAEYYVIEAGDTLESVADQYGTTVEQLLLLNPDVDPVSLTIGQRIRVG